MPKVYSYIRFSSEKQSFGASLQRQIDLAEKYALENGLKIEKQTYRDLGVSAFKSKNLKGGALGAFLGAVDQGVIPNDSILLVENLDRISRASIMDALPLFMNIMNSGITIVTVADTTPQVYTRERCNSDGGMSLFGSMMVMLRAHEESASKSKRVSQAMTSKREQKTITAICPAWIKPNANRTAYVKDTDKVQTVQKIFEMSAAGHGVWLIYKFLNDNNIPQLGNAKDGWVVPAVARLLHNQAVIGRFISKKHNVVIEDYYPSIIDKNVFFSVQEKMSERQSKGKGRKGVAVSNLFSGLCFCGSCGTKMRFIKRTVKNAAGVPYTYLQCNKAFYQKKCDAPPMSYEPIEAAILEELLTVTSIEFENLAASVVDPAIAMRAEIAEKHVQIETIMDMMEQQRDIQKSRNLLGRLSKREEELAELNLKLKNLIPAQLSSDAFAEAQQTLIEHAELMKRKAPELRDMRMKIQSAVKRFVKSLTFDPKITLGYEDEPKKYRIAYAVFHYELLKQLQWRDFGKMYKNKAASDSDIDLFTNEGGGFIGTEKKPMDIWFEVPNPGAKKGSAGRPKRTPESPISD